MSGTSAAIPAGTAPVLRTTGVDLVRDGRAVLREVSLTVRPGEHWALLGANGAGKSTLLRLLGALTHPTRGTVEVLGHELGRVDLRALRAYVGHVDPRHPLSSALTVRDVVLTGLTNSIEPVPRWSPTPEESARAEQFLALLGVGDCREARWPVLSQGQRTRVLIARALMPLPRLLLLDEPATGLDVAGREQLIDRLDGLGRAHPAMASVLVTHHLEELPPGTTHALLLREGRCLAAGPVERVLNGELVGRCFGHPLALSRTDGRWNVRTRRSGAL